MGPLWSPMRVRYFIGAVEIRRLKIVMVVAGLSSLRTIFEASPWFHFMIGDTHLKTQFTT